VIDHKKDMAYNKVFEFSCAVRGFHYYRDYFQPEPDQILNCYHERRNPYDRFVIKCCVADKEEAVGHMPMEISRPTKFFIDRGATVTAMLTGIHCIYSDIMKNSITDKINFFASFAKLNPRQI